MTEVVVKKSVAKFAAAFVVLLAIGCAPEEKALCQHMQKVYKGQADQPTYLKDMDQCIAFQEKKKKRRGVNSYRREAECILAADTAYVIRRCEEKEKNRQSE